MTALYTYIHTHDLDVVYHRMSSIKCRTENCSQTKIRYCRSV